MASKKLIPCIKKISVKTQIWETKTWNFKKSFHIYKRVVLIYKYIYNYSGPFWLNNVGSLVVVWTLQYNFVFIFEKYLPCDFVCFSNSFLVTWNYIKQNRHSHFELKKWIRAVTKITESDIFVCVFLKMYHGRELSKFELTGQLSPLLPYITNL